MAQLVRVLLVPFEAALAAEDTKAEPGSAPAAALVTHIVPRAPFDPQHTVVMICGPEIMMRFTIREFQKRGVADENIYVSMERNMECGLGLCGHCQLGPYFVCKDGPVFTYKQMEPYMHVEDF